MSKITEPMKREGLGYTQAVQRLEILSPSDTTACSQARENPGIVLQMGDTYREKSTGRILKLGAVDMQANNLKLTPAGEDWEGSSQSFAAAFEFVAPFSPENDKDMATAPRSLE